MPFPFSDRPLNGVEDEAKYKIREEAGKVDVERFFLFLRQLCLHLFQICRDCWMIIVLIPSRESVGRTIKCSLERDAFGADAKTTREIHGRLIQGWGPNADFLKCVESLSPVPVAICIFAINPSAKITVVKIKTEKSACIQHGAIQWQPSRLAWGRPALVQQCD
jgi:hypothetical protein